MTDTVILQADVLHLFFFKFILIYLFLTALGLRCCVRAFSSRGEWGLLSSCGAGA